MTLTNLIRQQARDDASRRVRRVGRIINATDLGSSSNPAAGWDYLTSRADRRGPVSIIGTSRVWGTEDTTYTPGHRCPACGGHLTRVASMGYCVVCSASSDDPRQWPNKPGA